MRKLTKFIWGIILVLVHLICSYFIVSAAFHVIDSIWPSDRPVIEAIQESYLGQTGAFATAQEARDALARTLNSIFPDPAFFAHNYFFEGRFESSFHAQINRDISRGHVYIDTHIDKSAEGYRGLYCIGFTRDVPVEVIRPIAKRIHAAALAKQSQ